MDKSQRAEMYLDYLRKEGYVPDVDKDGDIVFRLEGKTYCIIIDENDEMFFRLIFPNFWPIESAQERAKVEQAALYATADTKVAKVFPVKDDVFGSLEIFCMPPENFKLIFKRSLSALQTAVGKFANKMRE